MAGGGSGAFAPPRGGSVLSSLDTLGTGGVWLSRWFGYYARMRIIEQIIVMGSGNWGLALANLFVKRTPVRVWTIDQAMADDINTRRDRPGSFFPYPVYDAIVVEPKYATNIDEQRTLIVLAVPSSQVQVVASELAEHVEAPLVVTVSKGFDLKRQCTMSALIAAELPAASVVVLTGPTIANEVAEGQPTRAVLACEDLTALALVKSALRNDVISFEVSRYPKHHEVLAALKGLVAIAVGMADGAGLGANTQGVIMTEGLRELVTVGAFFGIPESVAYGVSGCGDLITTCTSKDSRNRRLGAHLAEGHTLEQALKRVRMTVEGVAMSQTIETLWSLDVSIPLIHMVNAVLRGKRCDVRQELTELIKAL